MDLLHANCVRAGYLDMDGCTVVDVLPRFAKCNLLEALVLRLCSYFKPTCSECSTPVPLPGVVSVRGDSSLAICRECHKRMSQYVVVSRRSSSKFCRLQDTRN
jgi:hypothetical protein